MQHHRHSYNNWHGETVWLIGKESLRNAVSANGVAAEKVTKKPANQTEIEADSFDNPFDLEADEKMVTVN